MATLNNRMYFTFNRNMALKHWPPFISDPSGDRQLTGDPKDLTVVANEPLIWLDLKVLYSERYIGIEKER